MSGTEVDVFAVRKSADTIDGTSAEIKGLLTSLRSDCEALGSMWQGHAKATFTKEMISWDEDATSMENALNAIAEQLHGTATKYATVDGAE